MEFRTNSIDSRENIRTSGNYLNAFQFFQGFSVFCQNFEYFIYNCTHLILLLQITAIKQTLIEQSLILKMFLILADEANVTNLNDKEIDMAWAVFEELNSKPYLCRPPRI